MDWYVPPYNEHAREEALEEHRKEYAHEQAHEKQWRESETSGASADDLQEQVRLLQEQVRLLKGLLNAINEEVEKENDNDPQCAACGVHESEHALSGCSEGFISHTSSQAEEMVRISGTNISIPAKDLPNAEPGSPEWHMFWDNYFDDEDTYDDDEMAFEDDEEVQA